MGGEGVGVVNEAYQWGFLQGGAIRAVHLDALCGEVPGSHVPADGEEFVVLEVESGA